jgi:antitoxin ParD1/3/4
MRRGREKILKSRRSRRPVVTVEWYLRYQARTYALAASVGMRPNLPHLRGTPRQKVKTGRYNSASKVVREALRLFEERDRIRELQIQELRKKINRGGASLERGEALDGEEFFRALGREERELARKRKPA